MAVLLSDGLIIRVVARLSGRGRNTVRWHVRQIFRKLWVTRQIEVARLVLSLADLPKPVLKQ